MKTADDKIWIKETTEGTGRCSMAILLANKSVLLQREYPKMAIPTVTGVEVSSKRCILVCIWQQNRDEMSVGNLYNKRIFGPIFL